MIIVYCAEYKNNVVSFSASKVEPGVKVNFCINILLMLFTLKQCTIIFTCHSEFFFPMDECKASVSWLNVKLEAGVFNSPFTVLSRDPTAHSMRRLRISTA